jgi:hypothetical protein
MKDQPIFACPSCAAKYRLVRIEAPIELVPDCEIACRNCGGPLKGRDGEFFLKYFMVERSRAANRRPTKAVPAMPGVEVPPVAEPSVAQL